MLNTFLIQIFCKCQDYDAVRLQFKEMSRYSSWTQTDVLLLFRNLLSSWDHGRIVCVIYSVSECDISCMAFLEDICSFAKHAERRFKIVIASNVDRNIQSVLEDWPTINLDNHQDNDLQESFNTADKDLASDIDLGVLELMQQRPEFADFEKRITKKLFECGQDTHWRRLALTQLRSSEGLHTRLVIEWKLDILSPTTPKEIFIRILAKYR